MFIFTKNFTKELISLCLIAIFPSASAQPSVGFREQSLSFTSGDQIDIAVWYPTTVSAVPVTLGPTTMVVASNANVQPGKHPLILISHGTGGMNLNHHEIATALAKAGSMVVALTHPKDNFKDRSMVGSIAYFTERPKQVSRVLDSLLSEPSWSDFIDHEKIGFLGHSAGGFTGLALLGATPSLANTVKHCANNFDNDLWFCNVSGTKERAIENAKNIGYLPAIQSSKDSRFKAAVLIAPVGAFTDASALSSITAPTLIYVAGKDEVLIPKFHAAAVAQGIPNAEKIEISQGGHFMLVSKLNLPANVSVSISGAEVNADPTGFDRAQTIRTASEAIPKWFASRLR